MIIIIITAIWIHGLLGEVAASHVEMDFNRGWEVFVLRCIICHQCPVSLPLKMLPTKNDSVTYHVLLRYIHVSMLGIIFKIFMTPPPPNTRFHDPPLKKSKLAYLIRWTDVQTFFLRSTEGKKWPTFQSKNTGRFYEIKTIVHFRKEKSYQIWYDKVLIPLFICTILHHATLFWMWYMVAPITINITHNYVPISSGKSRSADTSVVVDSIWAISMEKDELWHSSTSVKLLKIYISKSRKAMDFRF